MKKIWLLFFIASVFVVSCTEQAAQEAGNETPEVAEQAEAVEEAEIAAPTVYDPVQWTIEQNKISDTESDFVFSCKIEEGWKVYWKSYVEDGPFPIDVINESDNDNLVIGEATPDHDAKEYEDEIFGGKVAIFKDEVVITQNVKLKDAAGNRTFKGGLEFQTCNDERCLPPGFEEFEFSL